MKLRTLLMGVTLAAALVHTLGLPVEKELLRVKRKGELDEDDELVYRLHKRDLSAEMRQHDEDELPQELERELHRKRRFEAETAQQEEGHFANKMAARSSRSNREDNDVIARGLGRFTPRNTEGEKQSAKRSVSETLPEQDDTSASGMWISDSASAEFLSSKRNKKRSLNSIENIVAALSAINTVSSDADDDSATSGAWEISGNQEKHDGDKQPDVTESSASGSDSDLEADLEAEALRAEPADSNHVKRRAMLEDYLGVPDGEHKKQDNIDVTKRDTSRNVKHVNHLARFFRSVEADIAATEQAANKLISKRKTTTGDESEGGLNLVKRFYRDQEMREAGERKAAPKVPSGHITAKSKVPDEPSIKVVSTSSLRDTPRDIKAQQVKPVAKTKVPEEKSGNMDDEEIFESRVVRKKKIPKMEVTIFEEPPVYAKSEDKQMDSSDGGVDTSDWDEPSIELHVRDIREDGYVGCYMDHTPERDLPYPISVRDITPNACRLACKHSKHAYAGLQYGYLCRCGDTYGKYAKLDDFQCSSPCKGDPSKICGGFFRNSIYTTEEASEPTHGEFLHIESVQPLNQISYNPPARYPQAQQYFSPIPNYAPQPAPAPMFLMGPQVQMPQPVSAPAYFSSEDPGMIIHSEAPLSSVESAPVNAVVKAQVASSPIPYETPHVLGNLASVKMSSIAKPPQSQPKAQGSRIAYLHQQHGSVAKGSVAQPIPSMHVEPGTKTYVGSVELKQSWKDGYQRKNTPEYKILSGNLEQAKMFRRNPFFKKAFVLGFSEGLVKHNPDTIRKVTASFALIFKDKMQRADEVFKKTVLESGKVFDMPIYKQSLQFSEYQGGPATKPIQDKHVRRSEVPNPKVPYTLEFFLLGKKKRGA